VEKDTIAGVHLGACEVMFEKGSIMAAAQIDDVLARLAAIPGRVASAVAGWSEERLRAPAAADGWSAAEIFAHLRASDDIWAPRVYGILVRDQPPLAGYDERRWAEVAGYAQADFQRSLQALSLRRAELVGALRRATPEDWQRTGTHEERGTMTLFQVVARLLEHEEEHCAQVEALRA
jgi:uncharacterized damage-inducible protein DinB